MHIIQSFSINSLFNLGRTSIVFKGITINIYDEERMLIELMKNKNIIPYDYYKEIIDNYRKRKDGIEIIIDGKIEELHHQDYDGKRVYITLKDKNDYRIDSKLDIGVQKDFEIEQEEYCFELDVIKESATLFINSKEQIFTEKLKSLIKFAYTSKRYKDVFDFYYLIKYGKLDKEKLKKYINKIIFDDATIKAENFYEIYKMLEQIFNKKRFISNFNNLKVN